MFQTDDIAIDHFKDVPGFKGLLKAVLKHQIQVLVEQLSKHADEETIVLSASVLDGGLSYLGSLGAKDFLEEKEDIKIQFLRHCITKRHKVNTEASNYGAPSTNAFPREQFDEQPSYSPTMDQGIYHTSEQPAYHTSEKPAYHTSEKPAYHTSEKPAYHTSEKPSYHTSEQPSRHKEPAQMTGYRLADRPPKSRKLSHPQHIKPSRHYQEPFHHEQGMDLSNHSIRKSKSRQPSEDRSSPAMAANLVKQSSPPLSIVKVEPAPAPQVELVRFEENVESDYDVRGARTSAETEGYTGGSQIDSTSERVDFMDDTGQSSFSESGTNEDVNTNGTSGQSFELLPVGSLGLEQHHGAMFDQLSSLGLVNPAIPRGFSYKPQPVSTKKRVYRKVECDICHKEIYITNIKVHKMRHLKNSIDMG